MLWASLSGSSKEATCKAGDTWDMGSSPGSGRSSGDGHGDPLLYSCLENPMGKGALQATVHRVTQSWTRLKQLNTHLLGLQVVAFGIFSWGMWDLIPWPQEKNLDPLHWERRVLASGPPGKSPSKLAFNPSTPSWKTFMSDLGFTKRWVKDFPGGPVVKNPPANAGDTSSIPGPGSDHTPRGN